MCGSLRPDARRHPSGVRRAVRKARCGAGLARARPDGDQSADARPSVRAARRGGPRPPTRFAVTRHQGVWRPHRAVPGSGPRALAATPARKFLLAARRLSARPPARQRLGLDHLSPATRLRRSAQGQPQRAARDLRLCRAAQGSRPAAVVSRRPGARVRGGGRRPAGTRLGLGRHQPRRRAPDVQSHQRGRVRLAARLAGDRRRAGHGSRSAGAVLPDA